MEPRFLADEMLGKLARDLRVLGYDAAYEQHVEDDELLERARAEDRILLTRDVELSDRAGRRGVVVRSRDPTDQLDAIVDALELTPPHEAFLSRCIECNAELEETDATGEVPAPVEDRDHWRCPVCGRVYWRGTHATDMLDRLGRHLADEPPEGTRPPERERRDGNGDATG